MVEIRTNEFQLNKFMWGMTVLHYDPDTFEVDAEELATLAIKHFRLWSRQDKEFVRALASKIAHEHNIGD